MRLLVITANARRHMALLAKLADMSYTVTALVQVPPVQPVSEVKARYWAHVTAAEATVFPDVTVAGVTLRYRPLTRQTEAVPGPFDRALVFGGGLIGGDLLTQCLELGALNLHAGIAPAYRGTDCNFWAAYDWHPELVGVTVQTLTAWVDKGLVLAYATQGGYGTPWVASMQTVADAFTLACQALEGPLPPPDFALTTHAVVRYSRAAEFTDQVAAEFLARHA